LSRDYEEAYERLISMVVVPEPIVLDRHSEAPSGTDPEEWMAGVLLNGGHEFAVKGGPTLAAGRRVGRVVYAGWYRLGNMFDPLTEGRGLLRASASAEIQAVAVSVPLGSGYSMFWTENQQGWLIGAIRADGSMAKLDQAYEPLIAYARKK
jgi:hypothetical protein